MKNNFVDFLVVLKGSGTQLELAQKLGITQASVSRLLDGSNTPGYELLQRLVEMGYNPMLMLTGKGPLRLEGGQSELPIQLAKVAEVLHKYPEQLATFAELIELREKLEVAQDDLKAKLRYPKKGNKHS